MASFEELRNITIERLGEYHQQSYAPESNATYGDALILRRLKDKYRNLYRDATKRNALLFSSTEEDTVAAGAESTSLASWNSIDLTTRPIERIEELSGGNYYELNRMTAPEYSAYQRSKLSPPAMQPKGHAYLEGGRLYLLPKRNVAATIRLTFVPVLSLTAITTTTWATDYPSEFPEEHHELIALATAMSLLGEGSMVPPGLREEYLDRKADFFEWLSNPHGAGTRRVHER